VIAQLACAGMGRKVDLDDLMDATDVANLIGVTNANVVGVYRRRYDDFPPPVWASRGGRCQLWVRADVEAWARATGRSEAWAHKTGRL
jgi:predicted DNA-binding transcriptional regulator AlpA